MRDLARAREMLKKYKPRHDKLNPARKLLLQQEVNRAEDLEKKVSEAVANAWMSGRMYWMPPPSETNSTWTWIDPGARSSV